MAKVFDLVHKAIEPNEQQSTSAIPFDDQANEAAEKPPKKKLKLELVFFGLLLFGIFFVMGFIFIAPNLFGGQSKSTAVKVSPTPVSGPAAGFTITKEGESETSAASALGVKPSPTASNTATAAPAAATTPTEKTTVGAATIQILNGTNRTGTAAKLRDQLAAKGIVVDSIGNYKKRTVKRTTVYFWSDYRQAAREVLAVTGGIMIEADQATTGKHQILVVIGASR